MRHSGMDSEGQAPHIIRPRNTATAMSRMNSSRTHPHPLSILSLDAAASAIRDPRTSAIDLLPPAGT